MHCRLPINFRLRAPVLVALIATASAPVSATRATTTFVKPGDNPGSSPQYLTVAGDVLYFAADDGLHGQELWKLDSDGHASIVIDAYPGPASSNPRNLIARGEDLCFAGLGTIDVGGKHSEFIWCTSGNARSTRRLIPAALPQEPGTVVFDIGREYLFSVQRSPDLGRELRLICGDDLIWSVDTMPGPLSGIPQEGLFFEMLGERLVFSVQDGPPGHRELWISDGTSRGTAALTNHGLVLQSRVVSGQLYFCASGEVEGQELWTSDGSAEGTYFVKDIFPGPLSSFPKEFSGFKDAVYFQADDDVHGVELWRTDGTEAGTWLVKDINPGPADSNPFVITEVGKNFFFNAMTDALGYELWCSDGTEQGTYLVKDIFPGPQSSNLYQPTAFNGELFFAAAHPRFGEELWKSDGTEAGTVMVKDINPGSGLAEPYYLTVFNDKLYFTANDGIHGEEVWRSDGTAAGTQIAADINPETRLVRSSNPSNLTAAGDVLFFVADDIVHGEELWWSHVETLETRIVKDIYEGSRHAKPNHLVAVGPDVFFAANDGVYGEELWHSDGSESGTVLVADLVKGPNGAQPRHLVSDGNTLFFSCVDGDAHAHVYRLSSPWKSPELIADVENLVPAGQVANLAMFDRCLYASVLAPDNAYHFLAIDVDAGESRVLPISLPRPAVWEAFAPLARDVLGGSTSTLDGDLLRAYLSLPGMQNRYASFGGHSYFAAYTSERGSELWRSTEGMEDAVLLLDCFPGKPGSGPSEFTVVPGCLYFVAEHPGLGRELWAIQSAGQETPTVLDWAGSGAQGTNPHGLLAFRDQLFYAGPPYASQGTVTDGRTSSLAASWHSARGLASGIELAANPHNLYNPEELTVVRDYLYFSGEERSSGRELWRYGGSPSKSTLVKNILSDPGFEGDIQAERWKPMPSDSASTPNSRE